MAIDLQIGVNTALFDNSLSKMMSSMSKVEATKIAFKIDGKQAEQEAAKVVAGIAHQAQAATPRIDLSLVKTPVFATQYNAEITKVNAAVKKFEASVAAIKSKLATAPATPQDAFATKSMTDGLRLATKLSKSARKEVVDNITKMSTAVSSTKIKVDKAGFDELTRMAEKVKKLYGQAGQGGGGEGTLFRSFAGKVDAKEIQKAVAEYQKVVATLNKTIGSSTGALAKMDTPGATKQVKKGIDTISSEIKKGEGKVSASAAGVISKLGASIAAKAGAIFGKLKGTISSLFSGIFKGLGASVGDAASEIGGVSLGTFLGIGTFGAAIKSAANFEEVLSTISSITLQTGASMEALGRKLLDVSNLTGQSALTVGKAQYDISSAGFKGSAGMVVLHNSLMLAQAGLTDVNITAAAIARTMRAWNMDASESSRIADMFFTTVKRGITTPQELSMQMTRLTSIAAAAGVEFKEVAAMMANLTRNGQTTEQATTGLTALFKSIVAPAMRGKEAAKALGLEWDEAAVKAKGFTQTLIDAAPKIMANKQVFKMLTGDISGLKSAMVLAGDTTGLMDDLAAMAERGSVAQGAAAIATGFNQQLQRMYNNIVNVLRNVGQVLMPYVAPVLDYLQSFTDRLAALTNTDLSAFFSSLKNNMSAILGEIGDAISELLSWLVSKWDATITTISAVGSGLMATVGVFLENLAAKVVLGVGSALVRGITWVLREVNRVIMYPFDMMAKYWNELIAYMKSGSGVLGAIFSGVAYTIEWSAGLVVKAYDGFQAAVDWFWSWFGEQTEAAAQVMDEMNDAASLSTAGFSEKFAKGYESVYDAAKFEKMSQDAGDGLKDSLKNVGDSILAAGNGIFSDTGKNLKEQSAGMEILLKSLEEDYNAELAAGNTEKAKITAQFISQEKQRMAEIVEQLKTSDLEEGLKTRQKLAVALEKSRKIQDIEQQKIIISQIKDNEMALIKIEQMARKQREAATTIAAKTQINLIDDLTNKSLALATTGKTLLSSFVSLDQALDNIFGKNVDRLASEYGIGREISSARKMTRDVIEARTAGFKTEDIDRIVRVGMFTQSDALTKISTAFAQSSKQLNLADVKNMGLYDEIVKLLDQASALGMSEKSRFDLLQKSVSMATFGEIDKATIGNETTGFITQAQKQFENIAEEQDLQQRFNIAQTRLSELTKTAVTKNQQLKATVEELEKNVAEIERLQDAEQSVRVAGG